MSGLVLRLAGAALMLAAVPGSAFSQDKSATSAPFKIGVLGDQSGVYENISGKGAVEAVKMAVEDFGGAVLGRKIEVVVADHQNKPDIASSLARRWYEVDGVEMINDIVGSAAALATIDMARQKNRIAIVNSASSSEITGAKCTPNSVQYTIDTYALAKGTGSAVVAQGGKDWFFVTADYSYGHSIEKDVGAVVSSEGGKIVGSVRHPIGTSDFSSYLLQAQASKASIIALANAGADMVNALKTAREFGLGADGSQSLVGMLVFIGDIHALGLTVAKDLILTTAFYWDLNDETRVWSERFYKRVGKMPEMTHAGDYSSTMHYLKAVQKAGTADAPAVMKAMRDTPVNDFFAKNGRIREDGLMVHDLLLVKVKQPAESKREWDYYKVLSVIPGVEVYRPLSESPCPLLTKKD